MSEGMRKFISEVKIVGGIHDRDGRSPIQDEEVLERLVAEVASAIKAATRSDAYVTVEYHVSNGTKVNS